MKFRLAPHPAQRRHPVSKEPLFNEDGSKVPLFPDQHGVYLDDILIGYTGAKPGSPFSSIPRLDRATEEAVKAFIQKEIGPIASFNQPPNPVELEDALNNNNNPPESPEDNEDEYDDGE